MAFDRLRLRRDLIFFLLAMAEISWFTPWFLAISGRERVLPAGLAFITLLAFVVGSMVVIRLLNRSSWPLPRQRQLLAMAVLLSSFVGLHLWLYTTEPWWPPDWLLRPFQVIFTPLALFPAEFTVFAVVVFLWWRGIRLANTGISIPGTMLNLRVGALAFAGFLLLEMPRHLLDPSGFFAPFFFATLVAGSLTRVEVLRESPGGAAARFGRFWLGVTVISVLVVLLLGEALAAILSGRTPGQIVLWVLPVLRFLLTGLIQILSPIAIVLITVLIWLFTSLNVGGAFRALVDQLAQLQRDRPMQPAVQPHVSPDLIQAFGVAKGSLYLLCGAGLVFLAVLALGYFLHRQANNEPGDQTRFLWAPKSLLAGFRRVLDRNLDRLSETGDRLARLGVGSRFLTALSIRRLYAQMSALAATRGYPRPAHETPYEYLAAVLQAFPGGSEEVRTITDAYVTVHYGEVPDAALDVDRVRQAWQRLRGLPAGH